MSAVLAAKPCNCCALSKLEDEFHWQLTRIKGRRARVRDKTCKACREAQRVLRRQRERAETANMPGFNPLARLFLRRLPPAL